MHPINTGNELKIDNSIQIVSEWVPYKRIGLKEARKYLHLWKKIFLEKMCGSYLETESVEHRFVHRKNMEILIMKIAFKLRLRKGLEHVK